MNETGRATDPLCTVTIWREPARVLLTMNRDERRTRSPEVPPSIFNINSAAWIAPLDGEAGGTWIGVNDHGVGACILNDYSSPQIAMPGRPTRGAIIPGFLALGAWGDIMAGVGLFDPTPYAPFILLITSLEGALHFRWRGTGEFSPQQLDSGWSIITSSSWNSIEVENERRRMFQEWSSKIGSPSSDTWPEFNLETWPGREDWSPIMSRPNSATRSLTRVEIISGRSTLVHAPVPIQSAMESRMTLNHRRGH